MTVWSGRQFALVSVFALAALAGSGCKAVVNQRGHMPVAGAEGALRVGVDNKISVETAMGSPSTKGTFDDNTWYYISSVQEDWLFLRPSEAERKVIALTFDPATQTLASVKRLSLEDGRQVAFSGSETPTRGREMTILQQIFSNVGRSSPIGRNDEANDPRNRR
jgi:outer membrane protein assembly factor BamE (lipoprotein component of BamABCDE complex)